MTAYQKQYFQSSLKNVNSPPPPPALASKKTSLSLSLFLSVCLSLSFPVREQILFHLLTDDGGDERENVWLKLGGAFKDCIPSSLSLLFCPLFSVPGSILCFFSAEELFNIEGFGWGGGLCIPERRTSLAGFFR